MADVIGMSDVSSPDTGKGSQLKTGGKRKYNMPSKIDCNKNWKKLGYSSRKKCKDYDKGKGKSMGEKLGLIKKKGKVPKGPGPSSKQRKGILERAGIIKRKKY